MFAPRALALALALALAMVLWGGSLWGDESHYQTFPVGHRASGLGGAFVALADTSAAIYYNPAGLAFLTTSSFNISTSMYGVVMERYEGVAGSTDSTSFFTFPSASGVVKTLYDGTEEGLWRLRGGVGTFTLDNLPVIRNIKLYDVVDGKGQSLHHHARLGQLHDSTLWAGGSVAMVVHPRLAVGVTTMLLYRTFDTLSQTIDLPHSPNAYTRSRSDIEYSHFSLVWILGLLYKPHPHLSFGLTFHTPSLYLHGRADLTLDMIQRGLEEDISVILDDQGVPTQYRLPFRLSGGVAYEVDKAFALSLDVTWHGAVGAYERLLGYPSTMIEARDVVNVNVGGEVYILPFLPLRLGFYTDRTPVPVRLPDPAETPSEEFDMYGVTGTLSYETASAGVEIGLCYAFGFGPARILTPEGERHTTRHVEVLQAIVSGAYYF